MNRIAILSIMLGSAGLVIAPAWSGHKPSLIWNASASVPVGLYKVHQIGTLSVGDLVTIVPPPALADALSQRGYLASGVPLIKRVLALSGTTVCRIAQTIYVYGHPFGEARTRDSLGRELPLWQGCRPLSENEVFLMNWDAPDSFDGRYFGPLSADTITARLSPLWTDEEENGRYHWHRDEPSP
ncbi:S26 family signal peptidase [Pelagibacterium lentulum]|uniref:Peptidase S26 n=1 Tax=Pelagibacterium lentulum TaxID=2029865 RepID=A0A916VXH7_9HYPH|nr:S26 family signal peptidase [Pelagibacterium lentulum]GGA48786.1 peptidase S26 [Pelagibacterium lentulum]